MITKKELIGSELIREIISIRVDTLWKMLRLKREGRLPGIDEEGATGRFDNKGAIFVPGGLIYEDIDEKPIDYDSFKNITSSNFRKKIRSAMRHDNATLLYPDGIATGINLNNGFFSKAARQILTNKKAAARRKNKFLGKLPYEISSADITHSHCPTYIKEPYGARTRLSSCLSIGLIDPPMYYAHCQNTFRLKGNQKEDLCNRLDFAQEPIKSKEGAVLASPHIVVCHSTRYREKTLTGITRILGIGKYGEFATFLLEEATNELLNDLRAKMPSDHPEKRKKGFDSNAIFAEYENVKVVGVLRAYAPTTIGKRIPKMSVQLVFPEKDLGIDVKQISRDAKTRYGL
jgi:hypothetical protein